MKLIYVCLILFTSNLWGQSNFVSIGGTTTDGLSSVSFSVGQLFYHSYRDGPQNFDVNEGVQFAEKIIVMEIVNEKKDTNEPFLIDLTTHLKPKDYDVKVYPNPVTSFLNIDVEENSQLAYHLTDMQGRLMSTNMNLNGSTRIDFSIYDTDMYVLTIFQNGSPIKNYKIIKNKN